MLGLLQICGYLNLINYMPQKFPKFTLICLKSIHCGIFNFKNAHFSMKLNNDAIVQ